MKITRRQLRKLISEIRIKPGGDMDPEYLEKITSMIDSGDEDFITQADELAPMLGVMRVIASPKTIWSTIKYVV